MTNLALTRLDAQLDLLLSQRADLDARIESLHVTRRATAAASHPELHATCLRWKRRADGGYYADDEKSGNERYVVEKDQGGREWTLRMYVTEQRHGATVAVDGISEIIACVESLRIAREIAECYRVEPQSAGFSAGSRVTRATVAHNDRWHAEHGL